MSETVHPDLDFGAKTFKSLVWDNTLKLGLEAMFAATPWMRFPLLQNIITNIATMATNWLFWSLKRFVDMAAIPIINSELKNKFDAEYADLKIIAMKHGIDSTEFAAAREEASDAFADFIRFNGSRTRQ